MATRSPASPPHRAPAVMSLRVTGQAPVRATPRTPARVGAGKKGHPERMTLEAHTTAAGAGHPPGDVAPPAGALENLAGMAVIKEENVFVVSHRDGSLPLEELHPLGVYLDDCR